MKLVSILNKFKIPLLNPGTKLYSYKSFSKRHSRQIAISIKHLFTKKPVEYTHLVIAYKEEEKRESVETKFVPILNPCHRISTFLCSRVVRTNL